MLGNYLVQSVNCRVRSHNTQAVNIFYYRPPDDVRRLDVMQKQRAIFLLSPGHALPNVRRKWIFLAKWLHIFHLLVKKMISCLLRAEVKSIAPRCFKLLQWLPRSSRVAGQNLRTSPGEWRRSYKRNAKVADNLLIHWLGNITIISCLWEAKVNFVSLGAVDALLLYRPRPRGFGR